MHIRFRRSFLGRALRRFYVGMLLSERADRRRMKADPEAFFLERDRERARLD